MKRIISITGIVVLAALLLPLSCTAPGTEAESPAKIENTLQSVSYIKDTIGNDVQQLLSVFNEFNEVIDSIGYPDAGYKLWQIQEDSSEVSLMLEGLWPDQAVYDEIHNNQLYIDTWEKANLNWDGMIRVEYHRFTLVK